MEPTKMTQIDVVEMNFNQIMDYEFTISDLDDMIHLLFKLGNSKAMDDNNYRKYLSDLNKEFTGIRSLISRQVSDMILDNAMLIRAMQDCTEEQSKTSEPSKRRGRPKKN